MKHTFQHQLNMELLLSERRRTLILILIFTLVIIYRLLDIYFFHYEEASQRGLSVQVIIEFITCTRCGLYRIFYYNFLARRQAEKYDVCNKRQGYPYEKPQPEISSKALCHQSCNQRKEKRDHKQGQ